MYDNFKSHLVNQLNDIHQDGLYKIEREITSPQGAIVNIQEADNLINLCSNNYLGLAENTEIKEAAKIGLDNWGYGMASVRFICGNQSLHKELEIKLSKFVGMEDTILYPSCFDANAGLYETILGNDDAVISDALNHASIIDGIRLCKASRYRYKNNDMDDLENQLKTAASNGARYKLITTDGVFSMDGTIAKLDKICELAEKYEALVHFDDCHATGFIGDTGRGTHEYHKCMDKVDIITGTLGKALGGASGGYTSAHGEIVDILRQRSRPYLFSNTVAPPVVAGAIKAIDLVEDSIDLQTRLKENTKYFRNGLEELGFNLLPGEHPIVPIMIGDASLAAKFAAEMLKNGVYVIAFSYPVVAKGMARIRTQMSASFSKEDLDSALNSFALAKDKIL